MNAKRRAAVRDSAVTLVDADVHPVITQTEIRRRLPERWRRHLGTFGRRTMPNLNELYPRAVHGGMRVDTWPEGDDVYPGSDPVLAREQLLDEYGVDYAVLNCADLMICHEVPELAHELARAINDSLWEGWLDLDPRFVGAIVVPPESPERGGLGDRAVCGRRALGAGDPPDEHRGAARQPEVPADLPRGGRRAGSRSRSTSAATTRTGAPAGRRTTSRSTSATRSRWRASS